MGFSTQAWGVREWIGSRVCQHFPGPVAFLVAGVWLLCALASSPALEFIDYRFTCFGDEFGLTSYAQPVSCFCMKLIEGYERFCPENWEGVSFETSCNCTKGLVLHDRKCICRTFQLSAGNVFWHVPNSRTVYHGRADPSRVYLSCLVNYSTQVEVDIFVRAIDCLKPFSPAFFAPHFSLVSHCRPSTFIPVFGLIISLVSKFSTGAMLHRFGLRHRKIPSYLAGANTPFFAFFTNHF